MSTNNEEGKKGGGLLLALGVAAVVGAGVALVKTEKGKAILEKGKKKAGELGDQLSEKAVDIGNATVQRTCSTICSGIDAVQSGLGSLRDVVKKKAEGNNGDKGAGPACGET